MSTTYRQQVQALGRDYDAAVNAACDNADEMGLNEEDDAYWAEVLGQVTA